ncbi:MAG TPA: DinB family protein [Wenzhouxiangellaceae bacterium]|nr:DinB family protein [Wenzhouxiangellaceae bacterium]
MPNELAALLLRQHATAWKLASYHLDGLGPGECLWRPSTKGLHVSISDDGRWRGEWPAHEGYDLGPPSMAWLLWHMVYWWSMVVDHSFGDAALERDSIACPSDPDRVGALLLALHDEWTGQISDLSEGELRSSRRTRWPFIDRPFGDVVGWVNVELTKNASEIGYARFLYATRLSP